MQDEDDEPCETLKAMMEYNNWLHKFNEIWKNKKVILLLTSKFIPGK